MRYLSKNKNGTVTLWATVPLTVTRNDDGVVFSVHGVRRKNGRCILFGIMSDGRAGGFDVGDENFDVSDMPADHLPGYTIAFPEFEKDLLAKLHPDLQAEHESFRVVTRDEIPEDRTFREAWSDEGSEIGHNMEKVREIHLKRLRIERAPLLAQKDAEWMRAMGQGDTAAAEAIEAERQVLRDIPQTVVADLESASSIEDVKAITIESVKQIEKAGKKTA